MPALYVDVICLFALIGQRDLISCFIPLLKPTLTCTEAFDKYFRNYVAEKQYRNACRLVPIFIINLHIFGTRHHRLLRT